MIKKWLAAVGLVVLLTAGFIMDTIIDSGAFKTIELHFAGACDAIEGIVGAEDITIDRSNGLAYISSHDRRNWSAGGGIYLYQTGSFSKPTLMHHDLDQTFYPHGISLWKNPDGLDRLFVVNHPSAPLDSGRRSDSEVLIFEVSENRLTLLKTLKTDFPYSLNDVAAINSERFYATIDKGSLSRTGRLLETYGRLALGGIALGKSDGITEVAGNLTFPNGIQVDSNGDKVYVAETIGQRLLTYARNKDNDQLTLIEEMPINSGLDNIEWDSNGHLWIAAHPQMLKFLQHSKNSVNNSPSQVFRVALNSPDNGKIKVKEVYLNDGTAISGSSVSAPFQDRILIGSVYEPFILDCAIDAAQ